MKTVSNKGSSNQQRKWITQEETEIQQGILQQELKHTVFCRGYGKLFNCQGKDHWIYYIHMKSLTSVLFTEMNKPPYSLKVEQQSGWIRHYRHTILVWIFEEQRHTLTNLTFLIIWSYVISLTAMVTGCCFDPKQTNIVSSGMVINHHRDLWVRNRKLFEPALSL